MEDLDALLDDLESAIPPPITCGPKPTAGAEHNEIILEMQPEINENMNSDANMTSLNGNLSELDSLLQDLYSSDELIEQNSLGDLPSPKDVSSKSESDKVNIDNMIEELSVSNVKPESDQKKKNRPESMSVVSATQQLDDLMISLADFNDEKKSDSNEIKTDDTSNGNSDKNERKTSLSDTKSKGSENEEPKTMNPHPEIFAPIPMPPNPNDLDTMLQDMNSVLVQQGIVAASKGLCHACKKPVMGEVTTALGKVWHPEHFVCAVCDQEIGSSTFFEREGKPYCEKDYHNLFSPTCAYCQKPVLGQCVTALNDTWHPEHFFCAACHNFFGDEGFHEHDGKPYCRADFYNLFAPHCGSCDKPIITNYISALNQQWHPECFVCRECLAPFTNGSFFELNSLPYCQTHYHLLKGSLCAECNKPITGRCITAMGKKFHPEHFTCAFCLKQLNKGTFKEQKNKPYCHQCFTKLFTQPGSS